MRAAWCPPCLVLCAAIALALVPAALADFCYPDPNSRCWPNPAAFNRWRATLSNATTVVDPSQPVFLRAALSMNELKSNLPALIVSPGTERDLLLTLKFAARYRIRVVAKCSGHCYNDRSTGRNVLQINTQLLRSIAYNENTQVMTIGAGCNFTTIYQYCEDLNIEVVGGQSATVCLAGYLMGGGHSNLSPKYGLGIDNVVELRFALWNGTALTLSPTQYSDLFNAVLGSGANSYGVLISVKYKTYPAPPYILRVSGAWVAPTVENATAPSVLDYIYNVTWYLNKPENLVAAYVTSGGGLSTVNIMWVITGPSYDEAKKYIASLYELPTFVKGSREEKSFPSLIAYAKSIYGQSGETGQIWARKFLSNIMVPLDQEKANIIKKIVIERQALCNFRLLYVHGGVSMNMTAGSVPEGLRVTLGELAIGDQWEDPTEDEMRMKRISDVMALLSPHGPASYVNEYTTWYEIYNKLDDWRTRFYSNYTQLLEVKSKYDPCNLFYVEYGVGSDKPLATCGL